MPQEQHKARGGDDPEKDAHEEAEKILEKSYQNQAGNKKSDEDQYPAFGRFFAQPGRNEISGAERRSADIKGQIIPLNSQILPFGGKYASFTVFDSGCRYFRDLSFFDVSLNCRIKIQRRRLQILDQLAPMRNDLDSSHILSLLCRNRFMLQSLGQAWTRGQIQISPTQVSPTYLERKTLEDGHRIIYEKRNLFMNGRST